jgi:hypothetical protein
MRMFGDALQWVQKQASHLLSGIDIDAIDLNAIDSDLADLPATLKTREELLKSRGDIAPDPPVEDGSEYEDDFDLPEEVVAAAMKEALRKNSRRG